MAKKQTTEDQSKSGDILQKMETKYGKGSIVRGSTISEHLEVVSTGSIALNIATKCGGYPVGKLIELQGQESSGKSTGTLHAIAEFQKAYPDDECALYDAEQSFDKGYALEIGVDVDKLLILQADTMEEGYNMVHDLIVTGKVRLIVIDSHTAATPKKIVDGEIGEATVGLQARINSQFLLKVKPLLKENRCTLIGISQIRQDIGSMGEVNKSTGGNAWKFYADMRMKYEKVKTDKVNEASNTRVSVFKNKCAAPWGIAEYAIAWGIGIDKDKEIIDMASELEIINKSGSWYAYGESKIGQGADQVKQMFADNPEVREEIRTKLLEKLLPQSTTQQ